MNSRSKPIALDASSRSLARPLFLQTGSARTRYLEPLNLADPSTRFGLIDLLAVRFVK